MQYPGFADPRTEHRGQVQGQMAGLSARRIAGTEGGNGVLSAAPPTSS